MRLLIIGAVLLANTVFVWPQLSPLKTFQGGLIEIEPGEAIAWTLRSEIGEDEINETLLSALKADDYETAAVQRDLALYLGYKLAPETITEMRKAEGFLTTIWRNARNGAKGCVTGSDLSGAGIAGAIACDLTVAGDLRDITIEGGKLVGGDDYDEIVLGLSVVGVGLTAATAASGGSTLVGRVAVTVVKVAKKTGKLTRSFQQLMSGYVRGAVDFNAVRRILDAPVAKKADEASGAFKALRESELVQVLGKFGTFADNVGAVDAVNLMDKVLIMRDLENMIAVSGAALAVQPTLKRAPRAIIEFTDNAPLTSFNAKVPVFAFLADRIIAVGVFFMSLVMLGIALAPFK